MLQLMAEAEVAAAQKMLEAAEMEMLAATDGQFQAGQVRQMLVFAHKDCKCIQEPLSYMLLQCEMLQPF